MDIHEKAQLIRDFMEDEVIKVCIPFEYQIGEDGPTSQNQITTFEQCEDEVRLELENINEFEFMISHTDYHNSWDMLMKVVEKIRNLKIVDKVELGGHYTNIRLNHYVGTMLELTRCFYDRTHKRNHDREQSGVWFENSFDATYEVIVEFIKWHNTIKL